MAELRIADHAHAVRMDDQVIVADMRSGRYLGLDDVGARVWDLIGEGATRECIVERLSAEYDVAGEVLERDVQRLLQDLLLRRLVECTAG
ncbi:MAG: PqqD family protein [Acidobacteriota bacterium]|nr:PqqD family protein [Acidobacteriota bacterium]